MNISVVVPLFNEEESLPELYAWIERVMQANGFSFEVIFVNDGSTDRSWEVIEKLKAQSDCVKGIKFRRNYGKSPALYCGFAEAQGDVVSHNGCRLTGQPGRNTGIIPDDYGRPDMILCPDGSKKDMIRYQRHCRQSYSMLPHAKYQVFQTCTTSTAV